MKLVRSGDEIFLTQEYHKARGRHDPEAGSTGTQQSLQQTTSNAYTTEEPSQPHSDFDFLIQDRNNSQSVGFDRSSLFLLFPRTHLEFVPH